MEQFKHKKSLGQNFLKDENVLNEIFNSISVNNDDLIVEIGPGQGALTKYLIKKDCNLICYEVDERVKSYLDKLENDKCHVYYKDFLSSNFIDDINNINYNKLYFVANLPYYITTPIIEKIIDSKINAESLTFMVQKEVAERFASKPGNKSYGSISVYLRYYYHIEILFNVSKKCFNPVPNVDSAVIQFTKKEHRIIANNEKHFYKLIKDCFRQKRKNIKNNLYDYDLNIVSKVLNDYGFDLSARAESFPLNLFIDLSNELCNK